MNIKKFIKEDMDIRVRFGECGIMELNCYDLAKGLFSRTRIKNGKEYLEIRWDRIDEYSDNKFPHYWGKEVAENSWLEEGYFYRLLMKMRASDNDKAQKFQDWVSFEVLPSLRKNNFYINNENITPEQVSDLEKEIKKLKIEKGILHEIVYDISDATTMSFTEVSKKIFNKDAKYLKKILIEHKFLAEDGYTPLLKEADFKLPNGGVQKMRIFTSTNVEKCRKNEDIRYNKITNFGYMFIKKYFNKLGLTNFNFNKEEK